MNSFICPGCKIEKPLSEYYVSRKTGDPYLWKCKPCRKQYQNDWNDKHHRRYMSPEVKEKSGLRARARKYGITLESMEWLLNFTTCQICGIPVNGQSQHIDHDHVTGKIRGILCGHCNSGLGFFVDDVSNLERAIEYLEQPVFPILDYLEN